MTTFIGRCKELWKDSTLLHVGVCVYLFMFMIFVFGPAEVFFANATEFKFKYRDFSVAMLLVSLILTFLVLVFGILAGRKALKSIQLALFPLSLCSYIQTMFLNKNISSLGANGEGNTFSPGQLAGNLFIWLLIIALCIFFFKYRSELFCKISFVVSVSLLLILFTANVFLLITADKSAFNYSGTAEWHLSGEEQYTVSGEGNTIVLILDGYSNAKRDSALAIYEHMEDCLHDFTYYSNADCMYYGTYPSLIHTFTTSEVDMGKSCNDWIYDAWTNDTTKELYQKWHDNGYKTLFFTSEIEPICGTNDPVILKDTFDNVVYSERRIDVFYKLLYKTMLKMSLYRMAPNLMKNIFYTDIAEYDDIITYLDYDIDHNNYDFFESLKKQPLKLDSDNKYLIIQHLMGIHDYTTANDGSRNDDSNAEDTACGCMEMVKLYLDKLKENGVYDKSNIIITADHGTFNHPQMIFFIKAAGQTSETMKETDAPISLSDLMSTLTFLSFGESDGPTIYDFNAGQERERILWRRGTDENYPSVNVYTGEREGTSNVYFGYSYIGDRDDLGESLWKEPNYIIPMVDSFH